MSSRFDRRLEEAGLLKTSQELAADISVSPTPSSSLEDIVVMKSEDPGYAKLSIFPPHSIQEDDDECGGYMNPADALKTSPRLQQINHLKFPSTSSPSPPVSPLVVEPPSTSPPAPIRREASPYQSVDEIRKMREKQMKEKEIDEKKERHKNSDAASGYSRVGGMDNAHESTVPASSFQGDDDLGYSRPFDALRTFHASTADTGPKKPPNPLPWQRTHSNGKKGKEPSARFLHQIETISSSSKDSSDNSSSPRGHHFSQTEH